MEYLLAFLSYWAVWLLERGDWANDWSTHLPAGADVALRTLGWWVTQWVGW